MRISPTLRYLANRQYSRGLKPLLVLIFVGFAGCSFDQARTVALDTEEAWCKSKTVRLDYPVKIDIQLGRPEEPEVNIDKLKVGPRGWIFGSTEENGYMFIIDPETYESVVWNAGRLKPKTERPFEGDITDFAVWEESGRLIIIAAHAHPAELYRYEVPMPEDGLPDIRPEHGELVYHHERWVRIGSVERGLSASKEAFLLAGSITRGGLIRSDDGGSSWTSVDYVSNSEDLKNRNYSQNYPNKYSSLHKIYYIDGVWLIFTRGFAALEAEEGQRTRKHFVNGILYSHDGAKSWRLSSVEENRLIRGKLQKAIAADRDANRLPARLYGLVGEAAGGVDKTDHGLLLTTEMNTISEPPFGGRIMLSLDHGVAWKEVHHFENYRDIEIQVLGGRAIVIGTVTKVKGDAPPGGRAKGKLFLADDFGKSFNSCPEVVSSKLPSKHRPGPYWVAGVHSMALSTNTLAVGTVNEGEKAEIFLFKVHMAD